MKRPGKRERQMLKVLAKLDGSVCASTGNHAKVRLEPDRVKPARMAERNRQAEERLLTKDNRRLRREGWKKK